MTIEDFIIETDKLGLKISEEQLNMLNIYANFLIEYNEHTNLTAIKEIKDIYLKHFYDSLTITKVIDFNKVSNILDIGTGAGFPGMVLKIIFPNLEVHLLDSNNKKINFLKELTMKLNLKNIKFYNVRAEDLCKNYREKFDIVTARAVSDMKILSELCLPLTKVGGGFVALKGSNIAEIKDAEFAISTLGGKIERIENITLPFENSQRNIVKVSKIRNTDKEYPRRYDKIIKNPLQKKQN